MVLVNGVRFNDAEFHNGEVIFKIPENVNEKTNTIEMYFKDNRDITAVLFARQYLKDKFKKARCDLIMKYCPYERMDRQINDQMFSMRYFAKILGKFKFDSIYILDPHSKVCVEELKKHSNVIELYLDHYINKVIGDFKPDYICYPDEGAKNKYVNILKYINIPFFFGDKTRDWSNKGRIESYKLIDAPDLRGKKVLIIDDICCLGGTAYNAAGEMKLRGASEVAFYISHCEDGIFVGKLLESDEEGTPLAGKYRIDKIYTADTMLLSEKHEHIKIIEDI